MIVLPMPKNWIGLVEEIIAWAKSMGLDEEKLCLWDDKLEVYRAHFETEELALLFRLRFGV